MPVLLLAGCSGGLLSNGGPSDTTDVSSEDVPGVANGTLTNTSALTEANYERLQQTGAVLRINQTTQRFDVQTTVTVAGDGSGYNFSATASAPGQETRRIDQYANATTRFFRTITPDRTDYGVRDRTAGQADVFSGTRSILSAGLFTVERTDAGNGTVVLTADQPSPDRDAMPDLESYDGRLVVTQEGRIESLSVTATRDDETVTYEYTLTESGVESLTEPDWLADVPSGAYIRADLSVDAVESSYLTLAHNRGDTVPSGTTVTIESNGSTGTATLETSLSAGDQRYLYFEGDTLRVTTEPPEPAAVSPVTSPVSFEIVTEGGVSLQSGAFGWDSASAGDGTSEAGGAEGGSSGGASGSGEGGY